MRYPRRRRWSGPYGAAAQVSDRRAGWANWGSVRKGQGVPSPFAAKGEGDTLVSLPESSRKPGLTPTTAKRGSKSSRVVVVGNGKTSAGSDLHSEDSDTNRWGGVPGKEEDSR